MSRPETPVSAERKSRKSQTRPQSSRVEGSRRSALSRTQGLGVLGEQKVISVRDLFDGKRNNEKLNETMPQAK